VEVYTSNNYEIFINGTLDATGVTFTTFWTELLAQSGGTLNLTGCSVASGTIRYDSGSGGTISGSTIDGIYLNGGTPTVTSSTITNQWPIYMIDPDFISAD